MPKRASLTTELSADNDIRQHDVIAPSCIPTLENPTPAILGPPEEPFLAQQSLKRPVGLPEQPERGVADQ